MTSWLAIAQRKDIVTRAAIVSAIVGTLLVAINQGDALLQGMITPAVVAKIVLTYCVPYAVSTYASVEAMRSAGK
ncbi:MAG: nitrate/nitrite transporter NrtS [Deltaproteobacteria bacterium]|nr:nitrate/nitrite transporter NrtS [Deltaproteobacteria bacterium]